MSTTHPKVKGRPTLLDAKTERTIVKAIRAGAFDHVAAAAAGIGRATFYDWMHRGRAGESPFSDFSAKVERARAQARQEREIEVARTQPLAWLKSGPGRDRPGEPGWTDSRQVSHSEPKPDSTHGERATLNDLILGDEKLSHAAQDYLTELERVEREKGTPAPDDAGHSALKIPTSDEPEPT